MPTDVTYEPWHFYMALDNHDPHRKDLNGVMERYIHPVTGDRGIQFNNDNAEPFAQDRAIILVDDGKTVEPHYWAGGRWDDEKKYSTFHPFPTTTNSPTRADNGESIDWSNWFLGPRKAYHLKVRPVQYAHWHASVQENGRYTDRTKCFTGEIVTSIREAKKWLQDEMYADRGTYTNREDFQTVYHPAFMRAHLEIGEFSERSEGIDANVTVPWNDQEITYGYRIMAIEGDCEETLS